MKKQPLIEFVDVSKGFDGKKVLDRMSLKIFEGEVSTLIGLSGSGKSVTLKHIVGLLKPDTGRIFYRGTPIDQMSKKQWDTTLARISYMFQNNALFDSMTVFDNIALPLRRTTALNRKEIREKVMARIEQTELTDVAHRYPAELSGGMKKRTALARALVTDPQIVLFDEPTTGQDPIRRNAILGMVAQYQKKFGFTAVLISHDIPDVFFISNRLLALHDKKIVFEGTPEEFETFEHPFMNELVRSLEKLQEELTGLYSRRQFKIRYQTDLVKRHADGSYVVALFKLADMDRIVEKIGFKTAQQIIRAMGQFINKHFGLVGGFSTRQSIDEFASLLPFSNREEAGRLMLDFTRDLQEHGIASLEDTIRRAGWRQACVELTVLGGLACGQPQVELESIIEFARFDLRPIARLSCERGAGPS
ncbi:MAG: ATP-binding cassette domain-containing protein [Desulfobacterales bacterium]